MTNEMGFFLDGGKVVFANGNSYTMSGCAPDRVEVESLCGGHGVIIQPAFSARLQPCSIKQAEKFVFGIEEFHKNKIADIEESVAAEKQRMKQYAEYLRAELLKHANTREAS